jgi:myo-inositol-1-phosphate synthase
LESVIVVNVASTEPPPPAEVLAWNWEDVELSLKSGAASPLSSSTIYAIAAMQSGCAYVNFTPSIGSDFRGLKELAVDRGVLHAGRDGKTGETLLKSVLAPMFASRNLKVLSWVGHNIFGNLDGKVLADPLNKANKIRSKDHLLTEILGYKPDTLVTIEYIDSMGDWKTAWDHIHFRGFLNTKMTMQFTWQGCDSLLAAPLVLDLVRLTEREARRGTMGIMSHLGSFFKSPMGTTVPEFGRQFQLLEQWAAATANDA